ncbi:FtsX-like permease family protein [Hymenobacter actinosclerus]|uniref:Putative ABC transport system permease protein n=1 Tax=Hymenobacter actinosclerus TaxID=82805 RepID=A0A1I0JCT4_9BACT|nr:FtsX-like permease family protein [Hymenobacter actinosclerus]SEU07758.1 putative ABC transport system permease protein [Hymenobacter actinosclerus]
MIRHLFTLMWNRRRANALLVVEIFLAFVVLFAVGTIGTNLWANYRQPLGFDYAQVWQLNFTTGAQPRTEQFGTQRQLMAELRANPQVAGAALTAGNTPFSFNDSQTRLDFVEPHDSTRRPSGPINTYYIGPELRAVMNLELVAGRWFGPADAVQGAHVPVVIDERLQRAMYPDGRSALNGLLAGNNEPSRRVIGVVRAYRTDGELQEPLPSMFEAILPNDTTFLAQSVLLRVKPGSGAALEKQLTDDVRRIGPGWTGTIRTLTDMHTVQMKMRLTKPLLLGSMSVFLLLNVALGLFGVLWLNISRRRGELGVRRAMGATAGGISRQVLGEILVLTTFGLALGLLVAVQFPLLGVQNVRPDIYFTAMLLAAGALYLLATVCALYPSRLAAGIQPAVALREE